MKKMLAVIISVIIIISACPISGVFASEKVSEAKYNPQTMVIKTAHQSFSEPLEPPASGTEKTDYEKLEEILIDTWENFETGFVEVGELGIYEEDFVNYYFSIKNAHPEYFNVSTSLMYGFTSDYSSEIYMFQSKYIETNIEIYNEMKTKFDAALAATGDIFDEDMSDLEKALATHEYLTINAEYDIENYEANTLPEKSFSAYGVLVEKVGVCQSYAFAFQLILSEFTDISVVCCQSDRMNHIWNRIEIDGEYYQTDCTWDDITPDTIGVSYHTHFLKSDDYFEEVGYYDFEAEPVCTSTTYDDAMWNDIYSEMCYIDGYWYYISESGILTKYSFDTNAGVSIKDVSDVWSVVKSSSYYPGQYGCLDQYNGRLYYSDAESIYSINPDGTDLSKELSPDTSNGYIYGMTIKGNKLYYCLKATPYSYSFGNVLGKTLTAANPIPATELSVSKSSYSLEIGQDIALDAEVYPIDSTDAVEWESDNPDVAVVENGVVTARKAGIAVITATADSGVSDICKISVLPAKPTLKSATVQSSGAIKFSWSAVSGAERYRVYRKTSTVGWALISTVSGTSYTDSSVNPGTKYYYTVRAYFMDGDRMVIGKYYSGISCTAIPGTVQLTSAKSVNYKSIKVTWKAVPKVTGYMVYRKTAKTSWKKLKTTKSLYYTDATASTGTTYYYTVVSYKTVGSTVYRGKYLSPGISGRAVPSTPGLTAVAGTKKATLSWSAVGGASGYEVYRATSSKGSYSKRFTTSGRKYINTGLVTGKTYYYKVRAYRTVSGKKIYGSCSTVKAVKAK